MEILKKKVMVLCCKKMGGGFFVSLLILSFQNRFICETVPLPEKKHNPQNSPYLYKFFFTLYKLFM